MSYRCVPTPGPGPLVPIPHWFRQQPSHRLCARDEGGRHIIAQTVVASQNCKPFGIAISPPNASVLSLYFLDAQTILGYAATSFDCSVTADLPHQLQHRG